MMARRPRGYVNLGWLGGGSDPGPSTFMTLSFSVSKFKQLIKIIIIMAGMDSMVGCVHIQESKQLNQDLIKEI